MKVGELIEELNKLDKDTELRIGYYNNEYEDYILEPEFVIIDKEDLKNMSNRNYIGISDLGEGDFEEYENIIMI